MKSWPSSFVDAGVMCRCGARKDRHAPGYSVGGCAATQCEVFDVADARQALEIELAVTKSHNERLTMKHAAFSRTFTAIRRLLKEVEGR